MFSMHNPLKEKLDRGEVIFGVQIRSHSPAIAEVFGLAGADFIRIETEHHSANEESVENTIRAIQLTGSVPFLRIPSHDAGQIGHVLDMGVMGLILPHVDTPEEMASIWNAGKFPPLGNRGASFSSRAAAYGTLLSRDEYYEQANQNVLIIPMIESSTGVKNIEGIIDAGVDMIRIGRNDLSDEMGLSLTDPAFREAEKHVIAVCRERGIPVGTSANSMEEAKERLADGYRFIDYSSDLVLLAKGFRTILRDLRDMA